MMSDLERAVLWLWQKFPEMEAIFYKNPVGSGWVCELRIREAGVTRSSIAETKQLAAQTVAIATAKELGWNGRRPKPTTNEATDDNAAHAQLPA